MTIETAPLEPVNSYELAEILHRMYADCEDELQHISVVSAGTGAEHTLIGCLNCSFYDYRRGQPRLKQAGRGGLGSVFRNKKLKGLLDRAPHDRPIWRIFDVETEEKGRAMVALHRMRALLVKSRTMQVNQLRGLMYEFGVTFRSGRLAGLAEMRARMAELEDALPAMLFDGLRDQLQRIDGLEQDIGQLEKRIGAWQKQEAACRRRSRRCPASAGSPRRRWWR